MKDEAEHGGRVPCGGQVDLSNGKRLSLYPSTDGGADMLLESKLGLAWIEMTREELAALREMCDVVLESPPPTEE